MATPSLTSTKIRDWACMLLMDTILVKQKLNSYFHDAQTLLTETTKSIHIPFNFVTVQIPLLLVAADGI